MSDYLPRLHRRRPSTFWFVERRSYLLFVLRELSSLFVAWFVAFLLLLVWAIGGGQDAYQRFLAWAAQPWLLALNALALAFVVLHAVTWFSLAPDAMAPRLRGQRVPRNGVIAAHHALWVVVSALVAWLVLA
jgi:fumarate reductase subunit C